MTKTQFHVLVDTLFPRIAKRDTVMGRKHGEKVAGWLHAQLSLRFVTKVSTLATFSCNFFTCRVASSRVATLVISIARWRREKLKKSNHRREQKIARVVAALLKRSVKYSTLAHRCPKLTVKLVKKLNVFLSQ